MLFLCLSRQEGEKVMKTKIFPILALIRSTIAQLLGGWDTALQTLILFMAIDYITG
ncbi:Bacteriophage holin family protein [Anaerovirgula multivorans]|uniref:Bacteriophage holin family protein n=1 Tax=Anaerovirgula multivorans TaxID=312168 RepID=A0A239KLD7_9FIRM|nr:phage holin family protein [Anaerovirgula multivorans]SNT18532.1 Bacteriophage holin family protein [Anaerovirgula multivorans]